MAAPAPSLKARAIRYLAAREHSRSELRRKLARSAEEFEPAALETLLDELEAKGLLSAERFVQSLLHAKAPRFGEARLRQLLAGHELDAALVGESLAPLRGSEFDRAMALWRRRFGAVESDPRARARQLRFLIGRGFTPEIAFKVLKGGEN